MNNFLRKTINTILPDKNTRIKIRNYLQKKKLLNTPKMKLGVSYSVWDGEELLEASIKSIRENCDYINVVWQKISWYGQPCSNNLEKLLIDLKNRGLIDEIIFFEPNQKLKSNQNELNKRNLGLKYVQKAGCTHFLTMDTDEFYEKRDFAAAKEYILKYNITHTICSIILYPQINYRIVDLAKVFVPFIHKINHNTKLTMNACSPIPWLADPTRQIAIGPFSNICALHNISMHHFLGVRKDIIKKYNNSSANLSLEDKKSFVDYFQQNPELMLQNGNWIKVENIFNIQID